MFLSHLSIKLKLMITLGIVCVMLVTVGLLGISDLRRSNQSLQDIYANKLVPANALAMAFELLGSDRAAALRAANAGKPEMADAAVTAVHDEQAERNTLLAKFRGAILSARELPLAKRFETDRDTLGKAMGDALSALAAHDFQQAVEVLDGSVEVDYTAVKKDVAALFAMQTGIAQETFANDQQQMRQSAVIAYTAIGTGLGLAMLLSFLLIRSIARSLGTAVRVADNIAEGRLDNPIEIKTRDELGRLLESFRRMDAKLTGIVREVRASSESVGTAAKQIAQGNDDLSQRTQEQASSLEETASSMEEMTATVKQNADNASQANQLARGARAQAERGGEVAARAVLAMGEVNDSSRKIADIVSLIDEIAFQTNLLALNAAVEAARAGEQGRGFAVVASEVRSLAQRAAGAAKEIKGLIGDSLEKVRAGTELVGESGNTLKAIVESVKKVTDIVAEIAAASQEQSSGIDQVNTAVMQMDEVTQQNAALVEEAAAASRAMQEQAQMMQRQVAFFRIGDADAGQQYLAGDANDVGGESVPRRIMRAAERTAQARMVSTSKNLHASTRRPVAAESERLGAWKEF